MKKKGINKQSFKRLYGKCAICDEDIYDVLDVHRITPGAKGGKYVEGNSLVLCTKHHRLVHAGKIEISGIFLSSDGKVVMYVDEDGEERIKRL
jgi:hypothetical protein